MNHKLILPPIRGIYYYCFVLAVVVMIGLFGWYIFLLYFDAGDDVIVRNVIVQSGSVVITGDVSQVSYESDDIVVFASQLSGLIHTAGSMDEIYQTVRRTIVLQLFKHGYDRWQSRPVSYSGDYLMQVNGSGALIFDIVLPTDDDLDERLRKNLKKYAQMPLDPVLRVGIDVSDLQIPQKIWSAWSGVILFTSLQDLQLLGYEVVSYRLRTNNDASERRHNIATAFEQLGHIIVLNSGSTIDYLRDINFDEDDQLLYQSGLSVVGDREIREYGGGICGSSTAVYQGILTNQGLSVQLRNHTRRYTNLYTANINGRTIRTPGIDSALYDPSPNLLITNIRPYPMIIVMNYNGEHGGQEQVFSLGMSGDVGSFEFVTSSRTTTTDDNGNELRGGCYTWLINGQKRTSCYRKVE